MTLEDIKGAKYIELVDYNRFFSRLVFTLDPTTDNLTPISDSDVRAEYNMIAFDFHKNILQLRIIHTKASDKWHCLIVGENTNKYAINSASIVLADVLEYGDQIIFKLPDVEHTIRVNVAQVLKITGYDHKRVIVNYNGERRVLKTILTRWSEDYIKGIYTYDEHCAKSV